jgi:hypothetical protein
MTNNTWLPIELLPENVNVNLRIMPKDHACPRTKQKSAYRASIGGEYRVNVRKGDKIYSVAELRDNPDAMGYELDIFSSVIETTFRFIGEIQ